MELSVDRESGIPVGVQLVQRLRSQIDSGVLRPGDRLPSVRAAAVEAGVNVNTVRAAYGTLERDGLVRSEHGRGTFVAHPESARGRSEDRRELRRQIAALELELAQRPLEVGNRPTPPPEPGRRPPQPMILSAAELKAVRDYLYERLRELDAERADLLRRLSDLEPAGQPGRQRSDSSSSLAGARVRWAGA
jgi:DNA-binding transcriptional regulator YhcF (GntR family)